MSTVEIEHVRPEVAILRLNRPKSLNAIDIPNLEAAIQLENRNQIMAGASGETDEAARAFFEKRKPRWSS